MGLVVAAMVVDGEDEDVAAVVVVSVLYIAVYFDLAMMLSGK